MKSAKTSYKYTLFAEGGRSLVYIILNIAYINADLDFSHSLPSPCQPLTQVLVATYT